MTQQAHTRPPAVAGTFYQGDPEQLAAEIAAMLFESSPGLHPAPVRPKALIVPHAGHIYSGPIAARAYALLVPLHAAISRVVMLGPAHRVAVRGVALPDTLAFATPLGRIPLDQDAMRRAQALPQVCVSRAAHAMEHSLEVQLPFLQEMLDDFTLTPLLVGDASAQEVAEVIEPFPLPALRRSAAQGPGHRRPYPAARSAGRIRAGLRRAACKRHDRSGAKTGSPAVSARPAQLRRHRV